MKNSFRPFGALYGMRVLQFPFTLDKISNDELSAKFTMGYSNLNASKVPLDFDGKKILSTFFLNPGIGKICCGVSIITVGSSMTMCCFSDENSISDPQDIVDIFEKHNNKNLNF
jgi:hypothetical protein